MELQESVDQEEALIPFKEVTKSDHFKEVTRPWLREWWLTLLPMVGIMAALIIGTAIYEPVEKQYYVAIMIAIAFIAIIFTLHLRSSGREIIFEAYGNGLRECENCDHDPFGPNNIYRK